MRSNVIFVLWLLGFFALCALPAILIANWTESALGLAEDLGGTIVWLFVALPIVRLLIPIYGATGRFLPEK